MSDNHLKTPLNLSLANWMKDRQTRAAQVPGRSLPCTVAEVISSGLVKVNFEVATGGPPLPQMTVPVEYPEYIRYPIQVGDKGLVFGSDAYLGQITGQGPETVPDLTLPTNLGALSFVWLGNKNWVDPLDPDALELWQNVTVSPTKLGFFGNAMVDQQIITGALSAVADPAVRDILTSIIEALSEDNYGLVVDDTT